MLSEDDDLEFTDAKETDIFRKTVDNKEKIKNKNDSDLGKTFKQNLNINEVNHTSEASKVLLRNQGSYKGEADLVEYENREVEEELENNNNIITSYKSNNNDNDNDNSNNNHSNDNDKENYYIQANNDDDSIEEIPTKLMINSKLYYHDETDQSKMNEIQNDLNPSFKKIIPNNDCETKSAFHHHNDEDKLSKGSKVSEDKKTIDIERQLYNSSEKYSNCKGGSISKGNNKFSFNNELQNDEEKNFSGMTGTLRNPLTKGEESQASNKHDKGGQTLVSFNVVNNNNNVINNENSSKQTLEVNSNAEEQLRIQQEDSIAFQKKSSQTQQSTSIYVVKDNDFLPSKQQQSDFNIDISGVVGAVNKKRFGGHYKDKNNTSSKNLSIEEEELEKKKVANERRQIEELKAFDSQLQGFNHYESTYYRKKGSECFEEDNNKISTTDNNNNNKHLEGQSAFIVNLSKPPSKNINLCEKNNLEIINTNANLGKPSHHHKHSRKEKSNEYAEDKMLEMITQSSEIESKPETNKGTTDRINIQEQLQFNAHNTFSELAHSEKASLVNINNDKYVNLNPNTVANNNNDPSNNYSKPETFDYNKLNNYGVTEVSANEDSHVRTNTTNNMPNSTNIKHQPLCIEKKNFKESLNFIDDDQQQSNLLNEEKKKEKINKKQRKTTVIVEELRTKNYSTELNPLKQRERRSFGGDKVVVNEFNQDNLESASKRKMFNAIHKKFKSEEDFNFEGKQKKVGFTVVMQMKPELPIKTTNQTQGGTIKKTVKLLSSSMSKQELIRVNVINDSKALNNNINNNTEEQNSNSTGRWKYKTLQNSQGYECLKENISNYNYNHQEEIFGNTTGKMNINEKALLITGTSSKENNENNNNINATALAKSTLKVEESAERYGEFDLDKDFNLAHEQDDLLFNRVILQDEVSGQQIEGTINKNKQMIAEYSDEELKAHETLGKEKASKHSSKQQNKHSNTNSLSKTVKQQSALASKTQSEGLLDYNREKKASHQNKRTLTSKQLLQGGEFTHNHNNHSNHKTIPSPHRVESQNINPVTLSFGDTDNNMLCFNFNTSNNNSNYNTNKNFNNPGNIFIKQSYSSNNSENALNNCNNNLQTPQYKQQQFLNPEDYYNHSNNNNFPGNNKNNINSEAFKKSFKEGIAYTFHTSNTNICQMGGNNSIREVISEKDTLESKEKTKQIAQSRHKKYYSTKEPETTKAIIMSSEADALMIQQKGALREEKQNSRRKTTVMNTANLLSNTALALKSIQNDDNSKHSKQSTSIQKKTSNEAPGAMRSFSVKESDNVTGKSKDLERDSQLNSISNIEKDFFQINNRFDTASNDDTSKVSNMTAKQQQLSVLPQQTNTNTNNTTTQKLVNFNNNNASNLANNKGSEFYNEKSFHRGLTKKITDKVDRMEQQDEEQPVTKHLVPIKISSNKLATTNFSMFSQAILQNNKFADLVETEEHPWTENINTNNNAFAFSSKNNNNSLNNSKQFNSQKQMININYPINQFNNNNNNNNKNNQLVNNKQLVSKSLEDEHNASKGENSNAVVLSSNNYNNLNNNLNNSLINNDNLNNYPQVERYTTDNINNKSNPSSNLDLNNNKIGSKICKNSSILEIRNQKYRNSIIKIQEKMNKLSSDNESLASNFPMVNSIPGMKSNALTSQVKPKKKFSTTLVRNDINSKSLVSSINNINNISISNLNNLNNTKEFTPVDAAEELLGNNNNNINDYKIRDFIVSPGKLNVSGISNHDTLSILLSNKNQQKGTLINSVSSISSNQIPFVNKKAPKYPVLSSNNSKLSKSKGSNPFQFKNNPLQSKLQRLSGTFDNNNNNISSTFNSPNNEVQNNNNNNYLDTSPIIKQQQQQQFSTLQGATPHQNFNNNTSNNFNNKINSINNINVYASFQNNNNFNTTQDLPTIQNPEDILCGGTEISNLQFIQTIPKLSNNSCVRSSTSMVNVNKGTPSGINNNNNNNLNNNLNTSNITNSKHDISYVSNNNQSKVVRKQQHGFPSMKSTSSNLKSFVVTKNLEFPKPNNDYTGYLRLLNENLDDLINKIHSKLDSKYVSTDDKEFESRNIEKLIQTAEGKLSNSIREYNKVFALNEQILKEGLVPKLKLEILELQENNEALKNCIKERQASIAAMDKEIMRLEKKFRELEDKETNDDKETQHLKFKIRYYNERIFDLNNQVEILEKHFEVKKLRIDKIHSDYLEKTSNLTAVNLSNLGVVNCNNLLSPTRSLGSYNRLSCNNNNINLYNNNNNNNNNCNNTSGSYLQRKKSIKKKLIAPKDVTRLANQDDSNIINKKSIDVTNNKNIEPVETLNKPQNNQLLKSEKPQIQSSSLNEKLTHKLTETSNKETYNQNKELIKDNKAGKSISDVSKLPELNKLESFYNNENNNNFNTSENQNHKKSSKESIISGQINPLILSNLDDMIKVLDQQISFESEYEKNLKLLEKYNKEISILTHALSVQNNYQLRKASPKKTTLVKYKWVNYFNKPIVNYKSS